MSEKVAVLKTTKDKQKKTGKMKMMDLSEYTLIGGTGDITIDVAESAIRADDVFSVFPDHEFGDSFSVMAIRTVERSGFITVNL